MKEKKLILLVLFIGVVAFGAILLFVQNQRKTMPAVLNGPCAAFSQSEGEISCQQAVAVATNKYPGTASSIERANRYNTVSGPQNIWLVTVRLENPLVVGNGKASFSSIHVGVDRAEGKLLFFTSADK